MKKRNANIGGGVSVWFYNNHWLIDWFKWHVNLSSVILCQEAGNLDHCKLIFTFLWSLFLFFFVFFAHGSIKYKYFRTRFFWKRISFCTWFYQKRIVFAHGSIEYEFRTRIYRIQIIFLHMVLLKTNTFLHTDLSNTNNFLHMVLLKTNTFVHTDLSNTNNFCTLFYRIQIYFSTRIHRIRIKFLLMVLSNMNNFCTRFSWIRIIFKQIYLTHRWDPPTPGINRHMCNDNEEISALQNWSLTW